MAAGLVEAAILIGLVLGLAAPNVIRKAAATLAAIDFREPPPPPRPSPHHDRQAGGAPSPVRAPAPVAMAPPVRIPLPVPTMLAPAAGPAALGDGIGLAGAGAGSGSGNGAGEGGGSDAEWIKGEIRDSDYPHAARQAREQGTTGTLIAVDPNGRPVACTVRRSSGSAELDQATCRLILRRFRFHPARDASGHAIAGSVDYDQEWAITGYMGD